MSLRARLLVGMAVVSLVLVVAAVVITRTTESYLIDRVDAQLAAAQLPAGRLGQNRVPGGPENRLPNELNSVYVGAVDGDHVDLYVSPGFGRDVGVVPDISVDEAVEAANANPPRPFDVGTVPSSDERFRVLAFPTNSGQVFIAALSLRDVDAAVSRLVWVEVIVTGLVVAILGLVTWWVLRLGVRPIKQMTVTATAIAAGDMSRRIPATHEGTEAAELGHALNAMLGSIDHAFGERDATEARLRQFAADASHELRTPVATIRGYAELYRKGGLREADDLEQAMRRTEQEAVRMGSLIEDLLLLARLDQGRPIEHQPVDLGVLAVDAAADARAREPQRPVTTAVAEATVVDGDEHRLRQVVNNLVGNALVHTPPGTAIEVRVGRDADRAVLEVHDDGPGMSPDVAAHAFERFYRADPSRSRHHGGAGLGLSIAQAIVEAHGGTIALDTALGRGTTVRISLPLEPARVVLPGSPPPPG